jgi:peptidyl-prolyl cis-trans isomerase B (cyclophilin B)
MAKRRKQTPQRSHVYQAGDVRPGFSRKQPPKAESSGPNWTIIIAGVVGVVALLAILGYAFGFFTPAPAGSPSPTAVAQGSPRPSFDVSPPQATPLASPPAEPSGNGTTATISTELGDITFELFTDSAPVASENFINLADAGFYNGTVFHRLVPDFMIQGGDPEGTGGGGPGYTIPDEPIVGAYNRGVVAMARTQAANSQGSQFFIIVKDSPFLEGGNYAIFGNVTSGMDVVDEIVSMPTAGDDPGGRGGTALDPVIMDSVMITGP